MPPSRCSFVVMPNSQFVRTADVDSFNGKFIRLASFKFVTFPLQFNLFGFAFVAVQNNENIGVCSRAPQIAGVNSNVPRNSYKIKLIDPESNLTSKEHKKTCLSPLISSAICLRTNRVQSSRHLHLWLTNFCRGNVVQFLSRRRSQQSRNSARASNIYIFLFPLMN